VRLSSIDLRNSEAPRTTSVTYLYGGLNKYVFSQELLYLIE